jgi:catechol 2,3-dioxygenase-like lactoylglutathione lyase family enzyme
MITHLGIVTIFVRDQEEALAFYTEKLGFEKRIDYPMGPGIRWLTVAPKGSQTHIALLKPLPEIAGDEAKKAEEGIGSLRFWYFDTEDIMGDYQQFSSRGVKFIKKPEKQSWGGIEACFEDPSGNRFILVQVRGGGGGA